MRAFIFTVLVVAAGCGDSGSITPEPKDTTTSSGNSMAGAPVDGGNTGDGGASTGGAAPSGGNGTGGSNTQGSGYESGSRLKARTLVGADGSRSPNGWHDSQLDTDCQWRKAADGTQRCLPAGLVANRFLDDQCTEPVVAQDDCEPSDFVIVSDDSQTCGARYHVFPLAAVVTPATAYYRNGSGACTTIAVPQGTLHATGTELPASGFVAATVEIEP